MKVLPPGIEEHEFRSTLNEFRAVVGPDRVIDGDSPELSAYRDPYAVLGPEHCAPSAAVRPGCTAEVSAVIRIAAASGVAVSPVSVGRNLGYGGPAPRQTGAVVLDLSRMNRILEVNEKFGYALVEPGVTYFDLYEHLRKHHSGLWLDVPDLGWGSIIGNTMERGVGYTPYGDHLSIQCGMEVVLPTGDVVRTGMGALPGSSTWQLFKYGYGPHYDPMFTQANFGVVTKMGVWLMPAPAGYQAYLITLPREEDLGAFVDILRPLRMNMTIPNVPTLRNVLVDAAAIGPRGTHYAGPGPVPDSVARRIMADHGLGWWNFYGACYGPPAVQEATWTMLRDEFSAIPGAGFHLAGAHDSPVLATRAKIMAGQPNLDTLSLLKWLPDGGHIDFAPVSPPTGEDALRQYAMVRDRCHEVGKDYLGTFIVGRRELHHICLLLFETTDAADRDTTFELCRGLVRDAAALGYGEYRVHPALMDEVAATYGFNDNALLRLSETIKDALDPAGILAPGKQGIWPKRLRDNPAATP